MDRRYRLRSAGRHDDRHRADLPGLRRTAARMPGRHERSAGPLLPAMLGRQGNAGPPGRTQAARIGPRPTASARQGTGIGPSGEHPARAPAAGYRVLRIGQFRADRAGNDSGAPDILCTRKGENRWTALEVKVPGDWQWSGPEQRALAEEGCTTVVTSAGEALVALRET